MRRGLFMKLICWCVLVVIIICNHVLKAESLEHRYMADVEAYCKYIEHKNKAKANLLNSPDVVVRLQNSNNQDLLQNNFVSGLAKDLSDFRKAQLFKELINDECTYYKWNQEAKLHIQFAIPQLQAQALKVKLDDIHAAKSKLEAILKTVQNKIDHQNDTLLHYYQIDSLLKRLQSDERDISATISMQKFPPMQSINLKELVNRIDTAQRKRQTTLNKLAKQYNWSVQLLAGAQQSISNNQKETISPYAGLSVRYNLGALSSNEHIDNSLVDYMDWKKNQLNGVQNRLLTLMSSISSLKLTQKQQLAALTLSYQTYDRLGKKLTNIESMRADQFNQQLGIDRMMMGIEIHYLKHMLTLLDRLEAADI